MGADARKELRADCRRCAALCCVVPAFGRSADFAFDKPAGQPCRHLAPDFGCGIHDQLRLRGFPGCAAFDCFGAGQHVTARTHVGPSRAADVAAAFTVSRQLNEMRWHLLEAGERLADDLLREDAARVRARVERLVDGDLPSLAEVDTDSVRLEVGALLERVSRAVRAAAGCADGRNYRGADLVRAEFAGADLRGASLRGASLLGADLRGADLRFADLLGADLRAADLRGARLDDALFLTQPQVEAARGDRSVRLPRWLAPPEHWAGTQR